MDLRTVIPVLVTCAILSLTPILSEAAPNTIISITRSEVCEKINCMPVKDLIKYDNSTQAVSGKFIEKDGDYTRKAGLKNSLNYYSIYSGKLFVFVEPDSYTMARSHNIILVPSLAEYVGTGQNVKKSIDSLTDIRSTTQGVWVSAKCDTARVGIKQNVDLWRVISHIAGGCESDLGNITNHTTAKTKLDYCGNDCQHKKFMEMAKKLAKENQLRKK